MRTTVSIDDPLLESAKRNAAERGVTLSELVEDALRIHLAAASPAVPMPFRLHTVRGRLVNPETDLDRTSLLEIIEDEARYRGKEK